MDKSKITEDHINLIHLIEEDGKSSQRKIAEKTGLSIGKVNYIIKALIDIGFVKMKNFSNSHKKLAYAYILTPKGIAEKAKITKNFIAKKKKEYDKLYSYLNE